MGRAKVRKARRQLCRTAGRLGMTPKALQAFYRRQQALVNGMQLQRIIRHRGTPYFMGVDAGFSPAQAVEATFKFEGGKMVMENEAYRIECNQPVKNRSCHGPE